MGGMIEKIKDRIVGSSSGTISALPPGIRD